MKIEARIGDAELAALVVEHPNLEELEICDARDASAKGVTRLAELTTLKRLALRRVKKAVDKAAIAIAEALPLERFEISHCPKLSAKAVAAIGEMSTLHDLDLSFNAGLKDKALEPLTKLDVRRLSLHCCTGLDDKAFTPLKEMGQLVELDIAACQVHILGKKRVTAKTFKLLPALKQLKVLRAGNNEAVQGKALEPIATMRQLRVLELTHMTHFTADAWAQLGDLDELEELDLFESGPADDVVLEGLSRCANLRRLTITGRERGPYIKQQPRPYTDAGLEALTRCEKLDKLTLYFAEGISEDGLAVLGRLSRLRHLEASGCPCSPEAIAALSSLEALALGGDDLTDAHLQAAAGLPKLTRLDLYHPGEGVTAEGLAAVEHLAGERLSS